MACPVANPRKNVVSVRSVAAALAVNTCASVGRAGRYMSIENGAQAISTPSRTISSMRRAPVGAVSKGRFLDVEDAQCLCGIALSLPQPEVCCANEGYAPICGLDRGLVI